MMTLENIVERYLVSVDRFKEQLENLDSNYYGDKTLETLRHHWLVLEIHQALLLKLIQGKE